MTDEIEDVNDDVIDEPSTAEKQVKTSEKVFKQAEVDKIVQERIARERVSFKRQKEGIEADLSAKDAILAKYEEILSKQVEAQIAELPEIEQKIIRRLPLSEQLEVLSADDLKVSKKRIPPTPKAERNADDFKPAKVEKVI